MSILVSHPCVCLIFLRPVSAHGSVSVHKSFIRQTSFLTYVSRGATSCRHDVVLYHLGEAEITDHDLGVLLLAVVQDVLWLHRDKDRRAAHTLMSPMKSLSKCYLPCGGMSSLMSTLCKNTNAGNGEDPLDVKVL